MNRRTINPQSILALATLAAFLSAVLPTKWTGWIGAVRGPFKTVVAPVSGPLNALAVWLRPGEERRAVIDATADQLQQQLEFYKAETLRLEQQVEQMGALIAALQSGVAYGAPLRLRRVEATRVGADLGAGTIDVSRGSLEGVAVGAVAVPSTAPQHMVGIVTALGPTVSTVHLITDRRIAPNLFDALILPAGQVAPESVARAPRCLFKPEGNGTFSGEISAESAERIQRGDAAYLDDPSWPPGAQRLIIGRVVRTDSTDNPLFKRLVIAPDLDLMRVRSVILRTPEIESREGGAP